MKKLFTLLLLTFLPAFAMAEGDDPVLIDGICYKLIDKALAAEVVANPNSQYSGDFVIPSSITYENNEYKVTAIDSKAFYNCDALTSITIPGSISIIRGSAFLMCGSLSAVYISDLSAWCKIEFDGSYSNPASVAGHLYLNNTEIIDLIIPEGITSIGSSAFKELISLQSVSLPAGLKSIGSSCFKECTSLSSVVFAGGIEEIGGGAFSGCSSLVSIVIPEGVRNINSSLFKDCTSLTTVTISCNNIGYVDFSSFENCKNLKDFYCHSTSVPITSESAFKNSYINYSTLHVPEKSVDLYKADAVWGQFKEIIGFHVDEPTEVVEIVTPDGEVVKTEITIEIIDETTKTAKITSADIPASEEGCTEIAIPAVVNGYTITEIDANAFAGKTDVTDIYFPDTDQPITIGKDALKIDDDHVATVHVPVGLLGYYALDEQLEQNFEDGKVKATVVAPNRYWTFSCGVDVLVPEGVNVYTCKISDESAVKITQIPEEDLIVNKKRIIKANNGVLVACVDGSGGNAYDIVANPGGQWSGTKPATYDAKDYDDNMLEPVIVSKNYPATNYYVLKNGEFHKILANSSKMPAGKAVLRLPDGYAAARLLSITGGPDGTTGISNVQIIANGSAWYTLSGQRIDKPTTKGIYINNGKKVVVK